MRVVSDFGGLRESARRIHAEKVGALPGTNVQSDLQNLDTRATAAGGGSPTFVTSGATYNSVVTDSRILVNKTVGSATSIVLSASAGYSGPVLVKDFKGDADTNNITITFTGGELMDGLATVPITSKYGLYWLSPLATGGWYQS